MPEIKFESLTPKDDIDISSYEEALDFGLSDDTVTNIALTGPYGAGKSSVIETYKKKNKDKRFMNISLTHFEGSAESDTNVLEGKIVNQLLHQIDYDKIPQTIFKVKNNTKNSKLWGYTAIVIAFIISTILTFRFQDWKNYLKSLFLSGNSSESVTKILGWLSSNGFNIIILITFLISVTLLLYNFIKLQLNRQLFRKVTIKGNEVEIFKDREESYFDKFMNDVIYLFTSSDKDIIIFEDLDRFENATIYERLYEINLLINKRLLANGRTSQIKFIYLIKDDAFNSKDRTKLFDLIIPIVPVIDSSNSFEQFIKVFEDSGISEDFNKKTLRKLSLYIDDMRLLKNISNEYYIYKKRLSEVTLDNDKLLATIVYKNIFPKDFSNFQLGLGFINKVFSLKNKLIEKELTSVESKLKNINREIEESEKELLVNLDELDSLFFERPTDSYYKVNGKKEADFVSGADFISAIKNNNFEVEKLEPIVKTDYYRSNSEIIYESKDINISEQFEILKESNEYLERFKNINNKRNLSRKQLINKKRNLQLQVNEISSFAISELLDTVDNTFFYNKYIETEDIKYLYESPYFELIIFILREGLIDENYTDYLTYFYEHSLSKNDKEFLRGIYDRKPKEWKYKLNNINRVITEITIDELNRFRILNFDLFISYMSNKNKYNEEIIAIFDSLRRVESNDYILNIYEYFKKENRMSSFFKILEENWSSVLEDLILFNGDKRIEIEEFVYTAIYYFSIESIYQNNSNNIVIEFIEQSMGFEDYLEINKISLEKYLEKLSKLNIRFSKIESTLSQANKIVELNLFRLSESNLEQIFLALRLGIDEEFYRSNVTKVLSEKTLKENIYNDKLNQYIKIYLSLSNDSLKETQETVIELLNNNNLDDDNVIQIMNRLNESTKVEKITDINNKEYARMLCDLGNVLINGYNIIEYFISNNNTFSKELVDQINDNIEPISFASIKNRYDDEIISMIYNSIIKESEITNTQYASMLKSLSLVYSKGFDLDITEEKVGVLIDSGIIKVTSMNIRDISKSYSEVLYKFVLKELDVFIENFETEEVYNQSLLLKLLKNKHLDNNIKKRLINISKNELSILNFDYATVIKVYIINNKFDKTDLRELVKQFSSLEKSLQSNAYIKVVEYLEEILEKEYEIDRRLLIQILDDQSVENRPIIFAKYISLIELEELERYINQLNLPIDLINVLKGKRPTFDINTLNRIILDEYKRRGYINDVHEENGRYKVYGKRVLKK